MSFNISKDNAISLTRGDTLRATVSIYNPDGTEYEIQEGDSVRFAMKKRFEDEEPLVIKDIPTDTLELVIESEDTKELEFGKYFYDIQLTKANGDIDTFITMSPFKLTGEVD